MKGVMKPSRPTNSRKVWRRARDRTDFRREAQQIIRNKTLLISNFVRAKTRSYSQSKISIPFLARGMEN